MATAEDLITFIKKCSVTAGEAKSLVERAQNPDYWISLCPAMVITTDLPDTGPLGQADSDLASAFHDYQTYGHCAVHKAFNLTEVESLRMAVTSVADAGWPLIFAFVYDMFWKVGRAAKLRAFVSSLIGSEYQPTISFWV